MNQKVVKKINRAMKKQWREFFDSLYGMSFWTRARIAWALITYRKTKAQKEKDKIWKQRRKSK